MAYPQLETVHYTLGKGIATFQQGETYTGKFRDLGNAPQLNITMEIEKLEHFSSRIGARTKDGEIIIEKKATGQLIVDDVNLENMKLWFLGGDMTETAQASASSVVAQIDAVGLDTWQQIDNGSGVRYYNISNVVVKDDGETTTYTEGTDYEIDYEAGLIRFFSGVTIAEDDEIHITSMDTAALDHYTFDGLVADKIEGHFYFNSQPPTGKIQDVQGYCTLTPSGDLAKIGEDWQQMTFDLEFLTHEQYKDSNNVNRAIQIIERGYVTT